MNETESLQAQGNGDDRRASFVAWLVGLDSGPERAIYNSAERLQLLSVAVELGYDAQLSELFPYSYREIRSQSESYGKGRPVASTEELVKHGFFSVVDSEIDREFETIDRLANGSLEDLI